MALAFAVDGQKTPTHPSLESPAKSTLSGSPKCVASVVFRVSVTFVGARPEQSGPRAGGTHAHAPSATQRPAPEQRDREHASCAV